MDDEPLQIGKEDYIKVTVGNGGSSGIIYVPIKYAGENVKVVIPTGKGKLPEIIEKRVGKGVFSGYIYVHKRHLGKMAKIIFPEGE
ncbi:MAG: hypothetical protein PHZ02_01205 [Desulfocapsaceae bacterium]|nr:hypothetical protein [Desulfocapsaceae bacterium]